MAEVLTPEDEEPEVEPWITHNLLHGGWTIEKYDLTIKSAVDVHGYVDWKAVADALASPLRAMLADDVPAESETEVEEIYANAQQALDGYDVAMMEATMVLSTAEEPQAHQPPEEGDGPDGQG